MHDPPADPHFRPISKILPIKVAARTGLAPKQQDQIGGAGAKRSAGPELEPSIGKRRDDGNEGRKGGGNEGLAGLIGYSDSDDDSAAGTWPQTEVSQPGSEVPPRPSTLPSPDDLLTAPCTKSKDLIVEGE